MPWNHFQSWNFFYATVTCTKKQKESVRPFSLWISSLGKDDISWLIVNVHPSRWIGILVNLWLKLDLHFICLSQQWCGFRDMNLFRNSLAREIGICSSKVSSFFLCVGSQWNIAGSVPELHVVPNSSLQQGQSLAVWLDGREHPPGWC